MIDDFRRPSPRSNNERLRSKLAAGAMLHNGKSGGQTSENAKFLTPEQADRAHRLRNSGPARSANMKSKPISLLEPHPHQELLPEHASRPKNRLLSHLPGFLRRKPSKKQAVIISLVALLLIGSGAAFAFVLAKPEPPRPKPAPAKVVPKPQPKPILSPLTGLPVTSEQQVRPVTGIMIENSADARPQSGFSEAGIVFEAIAEYGVTRFLTLFQETTPENVGPVRSARPYFLDWTMAFDANFAHVGGSPDALQRIKDIGVRDLDQFYNSGAYWRIPQRFAPHNVYTSIGKLVEAGNAKGYTTSTYTPLLRKEKEEPAKVPAAKSIDFAISGAFYNVHYDYSPATNSYNRVMGSAPHLDNNTGSQLSPKVVVAIGMPYSLMADGYHSQYQTVGTGSMLVFQDGNVIPGTWSKSDPKAQFEFKDAANAPLKLNPGQTWITVLGDIAKATYTP